MNSEKSYERAEISPQENRIQSGEKHRTVTSENTLLLGEKVVRADSTNVLQSGVKTEFLIPKNRLLSEEKPDIELSKTPLHAGKKARAEVSKKKPPITDELDVASSHKEHLLSEKHPLEPFLPAGARILMLGSFPPPRKRWSMEFFYPNLQNDMWRIVGHLVSGDKGHFLAPGGHRFDRERIAAFCQERGIALYDTAFEIIRLKDNASDNFLQVVQEVDLNALLMHIPDCRDLVTTGQKATDTLRAMTGCGEPAVGHFVEFAYAGRVMRLWRMPSSSRAFPRSVEWKAAYYRVVFSECGII